MVPESELKNILITLSSIIISLSLGGIVTKLRDFKLKLSLEHINKDYASLVEYKESLETKLLITEEKLLVLKKGSVSNER